jgi:hypothetical protein
MTGVPIAKNTSIARRSRIPVKPGTRARIAAPSAITSGGTLSEPFTKARRLGASQ